MRETIRIKPKIVRKAKEILEDVQKTRQEKQVIFLRKFYNYYSFKRISILTREEVTEVTFAVKAKRRVVI